jgi:hypothetical protein
LTSSSSILRILAKLGWLSNQNGWALWTGSTTGGHTKAASYLSFIEHVEAVGLEEAKKIARLELANIKAVHAFAKERKSFSSSSPPPQSTAVR